MTTTAPQAAASPPPALSGRRRVRAVAAATIGNALEWFDIAIYALFAVYIGQNFFPAEDPGVQLIQTFAVFGGFTPTIAAALITLTGQQVAPGYYLLVVSMISISALLAAVRVRGIR